MTPYLFDPDKHRVFQIIRKADSSGNCLYSSTIYVDKNLSDILIFEKAIDVINEVKQNEDIHNTISASNSIFYQKPYWPKTIHVKELDCKKYIITVFKSGEIKVKKGLFTKRGGLKFVLINKWGKAKFGKYIFGKKL